MPPKPKFSEEKIVKTAYKIIKKEGLNSLTARKLAEKLESSARPIFTVFRNMDEVKEKVREKILKEFLKYLSDSGNTDFKEMAVKTVLYAKTEPELFKLLFMWENSETVLDKSVCNLKGVKEIYKNAIIEQYNASDSEADNVFNQAWIHIFGMATLIIGNVLPLSEADITNKITADIENIISAMQFENTIIETEEFFEAVTEELGDFYDNTVFYTEEQEENREWEESEKKKEEKIFSWLD